MRARLPASCARFPADRRACLSVRLARDARSCDAVRADVRENILREAVRDELIDREANAARVLDKQRTLFEGRDSAALTAFDRANQLVASVEASVASLCPHQLQRVVPCRAASGCRSRARRPKRDLTIGMPRARNDLLAG